MPDVNDIKLHATTAKVIDGFGERAVKGITLEQRDAPFGDALGGGDKMMPELEVVVIIDEAEGWDQAWWQTVMNTEIKRAMAAMPEKKRARWEQEQVFSDGLMKLCTRQSLWMRTRLVSFLSRLRLIRWER